MICLTGISWAALKEVLSDEWELASDCLFVIRARLLLYESDLIRIERRMALRAILDLHWVRLACLATQHSWRQSICLGPRVLPSAFGLSTAQRCGIRLCASVGRVGGRFCRSYHHALCGWHYIMGLSRYICLAGGALKCKAISNLPLACKSSLSKVSSQQTPWPLARHKLMRG